MSQYITSIQSQNFQSEFVDLCVQVSHLRKPLFPDNSGLNWRNQKKNHIYTHKYLSDQGSLKT